MEQRSEHLFTAMRAAGLRFTKPRVRLGRALAALPRHFSAEEALQQVNAAPGSPVSRATLYRFLGRLEHLGLLRRAQLSEGHGHYEFTEAQPEHCHLVCAGCGRVADVPSPALFRQINRLLGEQGFTAPAGAVEITTDACEHCPREDDK